MEPFYFYLFMELWQSHPKAPFILQHINYILQILQQLDYKINLLLLV
jgi:hypothetical protein